MAVSLGRPVERVRHADALDRLLGDAVDDRRLGQSGGFEHGRGDVDHVVELRADLAARCDAARPVDDRAVARSAPVRGDLLRPLVGRVHRVRPADREVVVRLRCAEVVDARGHELGRLERRGAVEDERLVEAAVDRALGARPVVADDVVDERVLEHAEVVERVHEPTDVVVGVLEEAGVDLHLAGENRLQRIGHVVPGGNLLVPRGQLRLRGHDSELLLASQDLLAQRVPALVEAPLVLVRPLRRHVVRSVRRARSEVHEERLVGHERLLLARPLDRLVGHVLGEVVALLGRLLRLDRRRALVDGRVVLIRLTADEAVEVLEAAATGRPGIEGAHRARLPDRHLVALAELRRRIAVQQQRLRQRRAGIGANRVVPGRRGGELRDDAHSHRVVVAPGQQGRPRRGAQRRRVEAVVLQAVPGQPLSRRRRARPAERARRGEADVVEQDDKHVGRARRWLQRLDRWKLRLRVLRVQGQRPAVRPVRDRKHISLDLGGTQLLPPFRATICETLDDSIWPPAVHSRATSGSSCSGER